MKIDIPLACPNCGGRMYATKYDESLKVLKQRSWQCCKVCNFTREAEDFKKLMCCV